RLTAFGPMESALAKLGATSPFPSAFTSASTPKAQANWRFGTPAGQAAFNVNPPTRVVVMATKLGVGFGSLRNTLTTVWPLTAAALVAWAALPAWSALPACETDSPGARAVIWLSAMLVACFLVTDLPPPDFATAAPLTAAINASRATIRAGD